MLKSFSAKLGHVLALYGGWGLFAISFLDSSFVPFPTVNDLLLMHLSSQRPERALMYALQCTAGSALGAYVIYGLARGGARLLWRLSVPSTVKRAQYWLARNDFVAVLVASLLPPPAPFKAFLVAAGALRVNPTRFGAALLAGRGLRFGAEALMGARYGASAEAYLKRHIVWALLGVAAFVVVFTLVHRRLARRPAGEPEVPRAPFPNQR